MTRVTRFAFSAVGLFFWISSYSGTAFSYAPDTMAKSSTLLAAVLTPKAKAAEICISNNGKIQIIRGFAPGETYYVEEPKTRTDKPEVKEGYTFKREAGGYVQKNSVSFDMFELMVEPFGGAPIVRAKWLKTFEEIFEGKITVSDEKGAKVGTFDVACNAAIVEF